MKIRGRALVLAVSIPVIAFAVIGGFIIGVVQHDLSAAQAANSYILLAIGDALVAQVPALLISVAAALVVSRVGKDEDVGTQISAQVFNSPRVLGITAGVIGLLGVIPGMPHVVFLAIAGGLGYGAWWMKERNKRRAAEPPPRASQPSAEPKRPKDSPMRTVLTELRLAFRQLRHRPLLSLLVVCVEASDNACDEQADNRQDKANCCFAHDNPF